MRILHLEASRGWGGQEIRILNEAKGMRQRGHEIFFVVAKGAKIAKRAQEEGFFVREISFQKFFWMISFFRLAYFLLFLRIDIVNTHSSLDAWLGGIVGRLLRKAIIRTRHLSTPIRKGWNSRFLYNGLADFVVTTCSKVVPIICAQAKKRSFLLSFNSYRYGSEFPPI